MFFRGKTFPLSSIFFADLVIVLLVVEGHYGGLGVRDPGDGGHIVRHLLHHSLAPLVNLGEKIEAGAVPAQLTSRYQ